MAVLERRAKVGDLGGGRQDQSHGKDFKTGRISGRIILLIYIYKIQKNKSFQSFPGHEKARTERAHFLRYHGRIGRIWFLGDYLSLFIWIILPKKPGKDFGKDGRISLFRVITYVFVPNLRLAIHPYYDLPNFSIGNQFGNDLVELLLAHPPISDLTHIQHLTHIHLLIRSISIRWRASSRSRS